MEEQGRRPLQPHASRARATYTNFLGRLQTTAESRHLQMTAQTAPVTQCSQRNRLRNRSQRSQAFSRTRRRWPYWSCSMQTTGAAQELLLCPMQGTRLTAALQRPGAFMQATS